MKTLSDYIKMTLAVLLVLICAILCAMRLMTIQVVNSEQYTKTKVITSQYTQSIAATRGQIVDAGGTTIIGNMVSYAVVIDGKNFPSEQESANAVLLQLAEILQKDNIEWEDTLPISRETPFAFDAETDAETISKMKAEIGVNDYATAQNCIDVLAEDYGISEDYTPEQKRMIAGIRYTMQDRDFSVSNRFELANGLQMRTITSISELSLQLKGVEIQVKADRVIEVGDVLPHEIGMTGPIYAENAEEYLDKGYSLDAIVGISGIEKAMEDQLQGTEGTRSITFENGIMVADEVTKAAVAGNTVMLTVDSEFQRGLQGILEDFISNFHSINKKPELSGNDVTSGALVVLDAKTGAVLGEATCPTYNLMDYSEYYTQLLNAENDPLFNRATMGLYRPGSTFKTITATAGLNEGIVNGGTVYNCQQEYFYIDTKFGCTGLHNDISVARALMVSCNSYFYELSRHLTIDRIADYAHLYGIGQHTGLETMDSAGYMATPDRYKDLGIPWTVGQVLQAGIGNGETSVTPLQLANVACTIANEGVRYEPYLVDSIWDYNMENCISVTQPTVAESIGLNYSYVYDYIEQGMILASTNNMPEEYSLENLGYSVAIKTGTPQVESRVQDSVFIGYAPANDPQIAFAGVIEGGEYSKYMIRDILELYDDHYGIQ